ncbi:glycine cleavage system aminomethyltransferase GcvT [Shinella sumterensis]|uniref:aminomethyltransferase n=1 Tax=Shinella sumterensis TaxID=1967501 RepID=A0AA50HA86_9HYPH|nr:glycine cleavage system aminomethyltransferase GcvT [Shinella sumterensis]WLS01073.1 glycine cleavage system aminomethyltransferase GcvT [Shinella sumterensis]
MLRQTPYYHKHKALNAEFVDRIGYAAALHFGSVELEHKAAREDVGLFDVYSQYFLEVSGEDSLTMLQKLTVNDIAKIPAYGVVYTSMCNADGGMIDDLLVYRMADDVFRLCPTPSRMVIIEDWLRQHASDFQVTIVNYGARFAYISVQGPKSRELISRLTDADISASALKYFRFTFGDVAGVPNVMISRTGYSGELGFELFYPTEYAEHVFDKLMEAGKDLGVRPCGLASLATLRMEKKFPLYGLDLSPDNTPVEAGLEWTVRLKKGDFMGREVIARQMQEGTSRRLVLLEVGDIDTPVRIGDKILVDGESVGAVTSVAKGFSVGKCLAQGYIDAKFYVDGAAASISGEQGQWQAVLRTEAVWDSKRERTTA